MGLCAPEGCVRESQSQVVLLPGHCSREIQGRKGCCTKEELWPRECMEPSSLPLRAAEGPASSALDALLSIQNSEKAQNCREIAERNQDGEKGSIK